MTTEMNFAVCIEYQILVLKIVSSWVEVTK